MKTKLITIFALTILIMVYKIIPDRRISETQTSSIVANFDDGNSRILSVTYPNYANLTIRQSRGGHRLSTWEYCMIKGLFKCEVVLVYGVNYIDII